jgi:UrcA family protein
MRRISTIFALAVAALASPALAGQLPATKTTIATVSYRGLDLATATGQLALDRRIARAARQVCKAGPGYSGTMEVMSELRCRRGAIASARGQRDLAISAAMRRQRLASASIAVTGAAN